ncbi:MAG: MFS transporter [Rhodopila sp.]|nr:MFS transporter [Rhodopila sp.]
METPAPLRHRWWILAVVIGGQFMFVVDAFIVNVAIPSIRADLQASGGAMEAVIAIYQIAFATLVITGGRLGDMYGRKRLYLIGLLGFTAASIDCGLAASSATLILARLAQGAAAALMSPQVLATIHTLFPDAARARAFAVFGIALGLGGATGFLLGGWLIQLDIAALGWRSVFFVNGPIGLGLAAAAMVLMPGDAGRATGGLDLRGAAVLFAGLLCLISPVLAARDMGYVWWLWVIEAAGAAMLLAFIRLERRVGQAGRTPLIDLDLLDDRRFVLGIAATACFFTANISVYLVVTLFLQGGLSWSALQAGSSVLPLALAFVVASRHGARRAAAVGIRALIEGCLLEAAGLAAVALVVADGAPQIPLILTLGVFGYGQGLVMAPLFGAVLMAVRNAHAGSGAGMLTTVQQIANGAGVALIGGLYLAVQPIWGDTGAMLASLLNAVIVILATAALLRRMGRVTSPAAA